MASVDEVLFEGEDTTLYVTDQPPTGAEYTWVVGQVLPSASTDGTGWFAIYSLRAADIVKDEDGSIVFYNADQEVVATIANPTYVYRQNVQES